MVQRRQAEVCADTTEGMRAIVIALEEIERAMPEMIALQTEGRSGV